MKRWWNKPIRWTKGYTPRIAILFLGITVAILVAIFSDPLARWWFAALIVGTAVVAILLHARTNDGGL